MEMVMRIYYDDFDYCIEDWQIAEAVADTFRRNKNIEGLKAVREDNSLEKFILDQIKQGNIDEDYIKSNWWDEIKEYWYEDFRKKVFYDAFDDIIKWNEEKTGTPKENLSPAEIVRLRKLADRVNDGSLAMEEIRLRSLIDEKNNKMQKLDDIVLKEGDIVYYGDNETIIVNGYNGKTANKLQREILGREEITKIERPHYETIYEAPKLILTQKEKEYLEAVLKPFKNRVIAINCYALSFDGAYIMIKLEMPFGSIDLPRFEKGTMYKGMELNKEYTLEELGLFKE